MKTSDKFNVGDLVAHLNYPVEAKVVGRITEVRFNNAVVVWRDSNKEGVVSMALLKFIESGATNVS